MVLVYTYLISRALHDLIIVLTYGRIGMIFTTFSYSLFVDQLKSIPALALIYCVVVRRFMHLEVNENEYIVPNSEKPPKQENAIPKLKVFCLKFLESTPVEMVSFIIICFYTLFILFWLTHADIVEEPIDDLILSEIDTIFLAIFFAEIVLKSFASNMMYLQDKFNMFDAVIVMISGILNLMGFIIKGLGVLRLIRVVVIILRKITGNQSKLRH